MTGEGSGEACAQVVKAERSEGEQCSAEQPWSVRRAGLGSSAWQADQSEEWEDTESVLRGRRKRQHASCAWEHVTDARGEPGRPVCPSGDVGSYRRHWQGLSLALLLAKSPLKLVQQGH